MTPQERVAYAARLLDEATPELRDVQGRLSDVVVEVNRWNAVAALAHAHVAVAMAQNTSVLTTVTEHVVQNAEPWQRGEIRPCPGNMEHVAHRHYDDGLGEWWCPGLDRPLPVELCTRHKGPEDPHEPHRYLTKGRRYQCPGKRQPPTLACGLHNNWPHDAHLHIADGSEYWCTGKSQ